MFRLLTHPRPGSPTVWMRVLARALLGIVATNAVASGQLLRPLPPQPKTSVVEEKRPPGVLDRFRPLMPEWLAMVAEIVQGGQFAPGTGWFEHGISSTRFDWPAVASRLDKNGDRSITRVEFPGSDADFRRLDRNRSGFLGREDFQFPQNALALTRSRMILSFADRDHDGKIGREEYGRMMFLASRDNLTRLRYFGDSVDELAGHYRASEKQGMPFLGLSDLRETIDLFAYQKALETIPNPDSDFEVYPGAMLLRALVRREPGALPAGPSMGDPAPDFSLASLDGRTRVRLSSLIGSRPVVLVFGNFSSPPFRDEAGSLEKLYLRYRSRAEFLMVYVREALPVEGLPSRANAKARISVAQPPDDPKRLEVARECRKKLGLSLPMAVDGVDDRVGILYSGLPDRLYLLDARGRVAYKGGRGPFGFKPDELEQSLLLLLEAEFPPTSTPSPAR